MAVLVAIAIPIFTSQLEKSRDSASLSNLRSAYAQAQASLVANAYAKSPTEAAITDGDVTINSGFNFGDVAGSIDVKNVQIRSSKSDTWSKLTEENQQDFTMPNDPGKAGVYTATFTYEVNKKPTVTLTEQTA